MPEKLLLKNAHVVDAALDIDEKQDVLIQNGVIESVGKIPADGFDGIVEDLQGKVLSPGWMDMHVHLREPGREDEETVESGSLAAANGGFTAVCCMPNTTPAIDSQEIIQYIIDRAKGSLVNVHPVAAITKHRDGNELAEILDLVEQGAVAISDDGDPVMSAGIMRRALEYSKMVDIPILGHEEDKTMTEEGHMHEGFWSTRWGIGGIPSIAEDVMIARDIMLAEYTGGRFHVQHIATKGGVDLVRQAKAKGISVTAEACTHHFTLTDEAVKNYDTNAKMKPPLRGADDVAAILEGLKDGTIDVIATDHAPHSWEEKASEFIYAPFGIVGLETAMGLSITQLLKPGILDLKSMIAKLTVHPYRILRLEVPVIQKGKAANITIFDPAATWKFDVKRSLSKSTNTPFNGWELTGKPHKVIHNGLFFESVL
ncbi:MAG: dihydroorotase [Calditrichaeota bacterium]|nr:dihydroorotase [Calditrichota bacterium]MCB9070406.1 dihydroorotase [Calditrichia bacterium]